MPHDLVAARQPGPMPASSPCLVQYQGGLLVCKCPRTAVEIRTIARQGNQVFLQALCKSARMTEAGIATGIHILPTPPPPLEESETGTVIVCGTCANPLASFHASAARLHANAGTVVAIGTFARPVRVPPAIELAQENLRRALVLPCAPHMPYESSIMQTLQGFTPAPPCFTPRWYPCIPNAASFRDSAEISLGIV